MLLAISILLLIFPTSLSNPARDHCTIGRKKLLPTIFDG